MSGRLPGGFVLLPVPPRLAEYQQLRAETGRPERTDQQAVGALLGSWASCSVRAPGGDVVGMGRVIGDGGWYFTIADLATRPGYQSQGLGGRVLDWLPTQVRLRAPADPTVIAVADPPARGLLEQAGFQVIGRYGAGMHMVLDTS